MLTIGGSTRVWLATGAIDMRRGFVGLQAIIAHEFDRPPLNGDLYNVNPIRRSILK